MNTPDSRPGFLVTAGQRPWGAVGGLAKLGRLTGLEPEGEPSGEVLALYGPARRIAHLLEGIWSPALPGFATVLDRLAPNLDRSEQDWVQLFHLLVERGAVGSGGTLAEAHAEATLGQAVDLTCFGVRLVEWARKTCVLDRASSRALDEGLTAWLRELFATNKDARRGASDRIVFRQGDFFPWQLVQPPATGLAILYNFAPFQDTGSTVASKRLRDFGDSVDVIACSFLHHKRQDPTIERISAPYVTSKYFLPLVPSWASWPQFTAFARRAADIADRYLSLPDARYEFLYTRAMWAPSVYAGALVKLKHPELRWIVEFSDPLSLDVEGVRRGGAIDDDETARVLIKACEARFGVLEPSERTVFALAERVAYALADEVIFTNVNQQATMLAHVDADVKARVERVSVVSNHPSLPSLFYEMYPPSVEVDSTCLNLAYFGEFYSARGLTEVTAAIRSLPDHLRSVIRLHVFTNYVSAESGGVRQRNFSAKQHDSLVQRAITGVGAQGLEDQVEFHPSLPYLQFLAATNVFDVLIVTDAVSGDKHPVNPYLPSKWSDYSGSRAATWALVEPGSVLSSKQPAAMSAVGDVGEAREVLWELAERHLAASGHDSGGTR